jgi:uncharacterized protein (TIGR01319 family)
MNPEEMEIMLATDCGSTTSKARLFKKVDGVYRYVISGEAPTTVEAPYENVCLGCSNAIREIEELTGQKILDEEGIITPSVGNKGVDLYVTTSSAGGGLQMMVGGVIKTMTAESAERAALGGGAIILDVFSIDDGREPYEKINRIRAIRPDIFMLAGGTDGGTIYHVVALAELIAAADPKLRLGDEFKLPIVYCGNKDASGQIQKLLGEKFSLKIVDNIRPVLEVENSAPARAAIQEVFMQHVMSHAPGYNMLMTWTDQPIMPTPAGEGMMFKTLAELWNINVIGVGLGGATTNIYSMYDEKFVRTVSANLGMSYSICNVMRETGIENILRWVPYKIDKTELVNMLFNKMIRPTTIPQTMKELLIEHAVAREALRLGFNHHKELARGLRGIQTGRTIDQVFDQDMGTESYIDLLNVDLIGGTGGLLSHAPMRTQSMLILIDGFQPQGVTKIVQDSVFMMPHLGVLSTVHPKAAIEIFDNDCLVRLGTCIAPKGPFDEGKIAMEVTMNMPDGDTIEETVLYGEIKRIPLGVKKTADIEVKPSKDGDVGSGPGHILNTKVEGGEIGILLDGRGRPINMPDNEEGRRLKLLNWLSTIKAYPTEYLNEFKEE